MEATARTVRERCDAMAAELGDSLEAGRLKPCMNVWRCSEVGIWRPSSNSGRNGEGMRIPACHACVACIGRAWAVYAVMEMPIWGGGDVFRQGFSQQLQAHDGGW